MVPDIRPPDGVAFMWARYTLLGVPDEQNIKSTLAAGWTFVEPSRYPFVRSTEQDKIVVGGLVLMERSAEAELAARRVLQAAADKSYNDAAEKLEEASGGQIKIERKNRVGWVK